MEEVQTNSLCIGDYITLQEGNYKCFMSAEGILSNNIYVDPRTSTIADSLFCVHLKRQYSAFRELEHFLSLFENHPEGLLEPSSVKYLQALKRGRDNEEHLNDRYLSQGMGTPVRFGEVIQLFHVKSGKYLTVLSKELAHEERENMRIVLTAYGSTCSYIQLSPRYKINRDGDVILSNTVAYLKVYERSGEFVHCASKNPRPGTYREVNCSMEDSSWLLMIFQASFLKADDSLLLSSELVVIQDPETACNLAVYIRSSDDEEGDLYHIKSCNLVVIFNRRRFAYYLYLSPCDCLPRHRQEERLSRTRRS